MAGEILLALAAACVVCAVRIGQRYQHRRAYEPRHTAEQPRIDVQHEGATEQWSPMDDIGRPAPIDLHTQYTNALAQAEHWQRAADQLRAQIAAEDEHRVHRALDAMERSFRDRLSRTGRAVHLEADTREFRLGDIRPRSLVRSGAPR